MCKIQHHHLFRTPGTLLILGPLLFIIYINELPDICDSGSQLFMYADDVKIYNHILNRQDNDTLLNDLIKLKSWADNWLINLNIVKCKTVSYGRNVDNIHHYILITKLNLKIYNLLKILMSQLIHA